MQELNAKTPMQSEVSRNVQGGDDNGDVVLLAAVEHHVECLRCAQRVGRHPLCGWQTICCWLLQREQQRGKMDAPGSGQGTPAGEASLEIENPGELCAHGC